MKFNTTENHTYRNGGYIPKPWIDCSEETHKDCIWNYFKKHIKVWDWDNAFDEEHDFLFEDGKAFRLYYSGWSEWHHEDDEENGLKDDVYIEEISNDEAKVPCKNSKRDWL